jgi:hypothetical protein
VNNSYNYGQINSFLLTECQINFLIQSTIKIKTIFLADVLLIAYISTILEQDLHSLVMTIPCSQVQRRPMMVERIHRNTLGQQQSYSIAVPWRYKEIHRMQKLQKETQEHLQRPCTYARLGQFL